MPELFLPFFLLSSDVCIISVSLTTEKPPALQPALAREANLSSLTFKRFLIKRISPKNYETKTQITLKAPSGYWCNSLDASDGS